MEFVIAMGLAGLVSVLCYQVMSESFTLEKKVSGALGITTIRQTIFENLKNTTSIANTIAHPTNAAAFSCLNNGTDCSAAGGQITLYDANNTPVRGAVRLGSPTDGFTPSGQICNAFNAAGNDDCPYQFIVSWSPRCPPGACINPLVKFAATLNLKAATSSKFPVMNISQFNINVSRPNKKASYSEACAKVGGTMISVNQCQLGYVNKSCPPPGWVVGFDAAGLPVCAALNGFHCPKGQVLIGIDASGIVQCGPGCTDPVGFSGGSIW